MTVPASIPFPIRSIARLSTDEYLAFLADRPENERWQLIDGYAFMMAPANRTHQTIVFNVLRIFNEALEANRPELIALSEVGLIVADRPDFRPQADIAIIDANGAPGPWQDRFYLAAEVLSESNTNEYIAEKRERYAAHPDNLYVLIIEQRTVRVEVSARANGWTPRVLDRVDDILSLPEFGIRCSLTQLYQRTSLA